MYNPCGVIERAAAVVYWRLSGRSWVPVADKANRMRKGDAKVHQLRLERTSIFLT